MAVTAFLTGKDVKALLKTGCGESFAKHYGALRNATPMLDQVAEKNLIWYAGNVINTRFVQSPSKFFYLFIFPYGLLA